MAPVNPPAHLQGATESSDVFRRVIRTLRSQQGIRELGDLAVTALGTPNMSVNVASGEAVIDGTQNLTYQGSYHVLNDGIVNLPVVASDPTNARYDLVVAQVLDAQYSGTANAWQLTVVQGTAAGTPVPPSPPPNSLSLAKLHVRAAATSVTSADITDLRVPGTGQLITRLGEVRCTVNTASINFTAIPQYYRTLMLFHQSATTDVNTQWIRAQFDGDAGASSYGDTPLVTNANSSAWTGGAVHEASTNVGQTPGSVGGPAGGGVVYFPAYSGGNWKTLDSLCSLYSPAGGIQNVMTAGIWYNNAAISSMLIFPGAGSFMPNSVFTLYGIP